MTTIDIDPAMDRDLHTRFYKPRAPSGVLTPPYMYSIGVRVSQLKGTRLNFNCLSSKGAAELQTPAVVYHMVLH